MELPKQTLCTNYNCSEKSAIVKMEPVLRVLHLHQKAAILSLKVQNAQSDKESKNSPRKVTQNNVVFLATARVFFGQPGPGHASVDFWNSLNASVKLVACV